MNEDFDDMETDERINVVGPASTQNSSSNQLSRELMWFPDPLQECLGFIIHNPMQPRTTHSRGASALQNALRVEKPRQN